MPAHPEDHRRLLRRLAVPTPALVLDLDRVRSAVSELGAALGPGIALHHAVKCNASRRLLAALRDRGVGFEVASAGELERVLAVGVDGAEVIFSAPSKRADHLRIAADRGVTRCVAATGSELTKLLAVYGPPVLPILRLAVPDRGARWPQSGTWGLAVAGAVELAERAAAAGCRRIGLTFHVGSQATDPDAWTVALERVAEVMDSSPLEVELLDLGGGFPVAYPGSPAARSELWAGIGAGIRAGIAALPHRPERVVAEPGRALVADAGVLHTSVVDLDPARGMVHTDAGVFNGLHECSTPGGGLAFDWTAPGHRDPAVTRPMVVGGISCDADDRLARPVDLPVDLATGEALAVHQAGAYSMSYATSFCGLEPPTVVISEGADRTLPDYEVALAGSDRFDEAVGLEHEVFARAGFLDADGTLGGFRRYDPVSRFLLIRSGDGSLRAAVRTVDGSPLGFTVLHRLPVTDDGWHQLERIGLDAVTEVVTLASRRPSLRSSVAAYSALWFDVRARDRDHVVAAIDVDVLAMIERRLGNVASRLGPAVYYLGSPTVAVLFDFGDAREEPMRRFRLGAALLDGAGHPAGRG